MGDESGEMHSADGKGLVEKKNKKRTVKTAAQLQALEKFFNEHKYPTETLKTQFAEAVGLTEKQVSGWFCHRRLKDKKLMSGDNNLTGKQDRSSGVIQDRGSGYKQDSCGSTKQGDDRNFDKEVESGRLTRREYSAMDLAQQHDNPYPGKYGSDAEDDDTTSGSSESNHQARDPFDNEASMYLAPKLPEHERQGNTMRSGPSGYLKVKGRVEDVAITAVKRQLGKHYRDDGPPLGVEFDPPPPGAFEFPIQNPVHERFYSRELPAPALPDASRIRQKSTFDEGHDYEPSSGSYNNQHDGPSLRTRHEFCSPNSYVHQNFRLSSGGAYHPGRSEPFEGSTRYVHQTRPRADVETMRMRSLASQDTHLPYGGKVREKPPFNRKSASGVAASYRENMKNEYSDSTTALEASSLNNGLSRTLDSGLSRQVFKEGITNGDQFRPSFRNDFAPPKRVKEDVPFRQHQMPSPVLDNLPKAHQAARPGKVLRPSSSDDKQSSAETSSSVDLEE